MFGTKVVSGFEFDFFWHLQIQVRTEVGMIKCRFCIDSLRWIFLEHSREQIKCYGWNFGVDLFVEREPTISILVKDLIVLFALEH